MISLSTDVTGKLDCNTSALLISMTSIGTLIFHGNLGKIEVLFQKFNVLGEVLPGRMMVCVLLVLVTMIHVESQTLSAKDICSSLYDRV